MSRSNNVLFIFRRDLRIQDNKGLNRAVQVCEALPNGKLILAFVFSKRQIDESEYYSEKAFRFMLQCLEDLNERVDGKLEFFDTDDCDADDSPSPVDACLDSGVNARVDTSAGRRHATVQGQHRCVRG